VAEQQLHIAQGAAKHRDPKRRVIIDYRGRICRVCGRAAPPPPAHRYDDLRVCRDADCRKEARRRDNLAKVLRFQERKKQAAQAAQEGTAA
jgi:hypothetical protein